MLHSAIYLPIRHIDEMLECVHQKRHDHNAQKNKCGITKRDASQHSESVFNEVVRSVCITMFIMRF